MTGYVLTDKIGLHIRATRTFVDVFGKKRKAGEEWLGTPSSISCLRNLLSSPAVTVEDAESYTCDVYEELVEKTNLTTLNSLQYCVMLDPYDKSGEVPLVLHTQTLIFGFVH